MTATISEPLSGWQRSVPLQDKGIFNGNIGGTTAKLDLCGVERLTQAMEQGTDFHPGVYTLTVSPNVNVTGELAGQALGTSFNPHLTFIYDRVHFYLAKEGEQTDAMSSTQPGILSDWRLEANTLSLFGLTLEVPFLRILSITGFIAALAGLIWLFARLQNMAKDDPVQFIRARYDTSIIDIQNLAGIKAENPVEVSSIDDLAKLAEKFNAAILHFAKGRLHSYYVSGEATVYRFVLTTRETESNLPVEEASA
jgi:hypothetical protein